MVFSSILFIFRFLPVALILYFLTPKKYKNFTLLILSLVFYSWGEIKYIFIMFASIFVDYFASLGIEKYRGKKKATILFLCISVCFNLGMLFFFKYFNFFIDNINSIFDLALNHVKVTLPLGISFYTFQTMSYTIDVFRGNVKAEKNIINFGAFVCLFPQLIAGPIVKYTDINKELVERTVDKNQIQEGVELFIVGLGRKVLIANNIGMLWTEVEALGFMSISTPLAWLGIIAFGLQIYFDFSGYSLMAIGLGKMLGFNFPTNFNHPYIARSMSEFWRRWHITLGSWFREYVYIPLGGNRVSSGRIMLNLFIVWFLTGFWHGASYNFIMWGLFFFILISIEKLGFIKILNEHKIISHVYVILFLIIGWALFAVTDLARLKELMTIMFNFNGGTDWIYYLRNYGVTLVLAIVFSTPLIENLYKKVVRNKNINAIIMILIFIVAVAYLVDSTYNPFLYFRF
ncbi:MBOAT family O-acyltransferase [Clostridium culturomicium]|uniref:MBOAT family O-acyltransferase n=1 Tax=Clostridium culturomicium TaxID=1499683 RepID=UPI00058B0BF8|nr:MBOAT family O-acyltransferase [Clostridium culturomicium]